MAAEQLMFIWEKTLVGTLEQHKQTLAVG